MSERILVPYDDSPPAEKALEYTFEKFPDAAVTALYVVPRPEGYWSAFEGADEKQREAERAQERGEEVLESARAIAADVDREFDTEIESGKPSRVIVQRAATDEYDTVVIGSHGRQGISRVLLGSVAENVVRRSPVPVVVVR